MDFVAGQSRNPFPASAAGRLLLLSWLIVFTSTAEVAWRNSGSGSLSSASARLDPNSAPWWELTVLPEVGPSLARRIVDYRDEYLAKGNTSAAVPAFRSVDDLDAVKGIGPKTIARLSTHLQFKGRADLSKPAGTPGDNRNSQK